ncbi:beta-galactosidase [Paenibacillus sp. P96]|uniref:Beta-galactosidase n=1 Tax=Paenibacillus zeirhizosphaerae TaxID=2987519 RepID=A0ABT9FQQ0_9BACL|nr:alpha-amylase family protein [Paenibacillus sp. P96]MDP4097033.1 beta-galactosidase [Paenibacillus sp. P96]
MTENAIVFYDPSFPYEGARPEGELFEELRNTYTLVDAEGLPAALQSGSADCLIHLHGSYFPKQAWPEIKSFLLNGGGLICIGGAPFKQPVSLEQGAWSIKGEQTAYHQELGIHEALAVDGSRAASFRHNPDLPLLEGREHLFSVEPTYGLILHVTRERDQLQQATGSSGPMNARITPLLCGVSAEGREVSAPVVLLEYVRGHYAGGRWLFVNQQLQEGFWTEEGLKALQEWAAYCSAGVTEIWLKPSYAVYYEAERAHMTLQIQKITPVPASGLSKSSSTQWSMELFVTRQGDNEPLWHKTLEIQATEEIQYATFNIPVDVTPGLYQITCTAISESGERRTLRQGYWGYDKELLEQGDFLSAERDYFKKADKPFPVVGMTYMTSDVGRKFVHLPNAALWDRDMQTMKEAGINWIRTGLWSAWRHLMFEDGHASEEILRAIDAFILTAAKHELEVTFTFFAFAPAAWEGLNPYLDPRSVQAQKRFIASVVSRHKDTVNVQWDLINEPSLFDPMRIFTGPRTLGDAFEKAEYVKWLQQRHGSIEALQDRWNMTSTELPDFDAVTLPEQTDIAFDIEDVKKLKKNTRWLDYTLFGMDMHNRWAEELRATIRSIQPRHLVTVGQDEALGRGPRPSPLFYAESVDYTNVHTWWLNDSLLWDGIFGKSPDKPLLVQETGIMYVEQPDNRAKRTEEELRNLLERKYAYAFASGGAGAIHWLWNTNYYMDNVCESNIGALRADGTQKPEADVSYDFGAFMQSIAGLFEERRLEDVAVVFPYSNDFSSRRFACEATARLTRVMGYELRQPIRALSEYHLASLATEQPKLIIVPSAHNFSDDALDTLLGHIEQEGGTLLFTGPLGLDEYWKPTSRAETIAGSQKLANVAREETVFINGYRYIASFSGKKIGELNKEVPAQENGVRKGCEVQTFGHGKGKIMWCPVPLELNERTDVLKSLYETALQEADVAKPALTWVKGGDHPGLYGTRLRFREGSLYIFISETAEESEIEVKDEESGVLYSFNLKADRAMLFAADLEGSLLSVYRDAQVKSMLHTTS